MYVDVIEYITDEDGIEMDTDGVAWSYDIAQKYKQVDGYVDALVTNTSLSCSEVLGSAYSDCNVYVDGDDTYYYKYPDDDSVQYLYETYDIISPLKGVTDERFMNWMRMAGLPSFRKLYGKIDNDISAGDSWSFNLTLNYEVRSFGASKYLVLSDLSNIGAPNYSLGNVYFAAGSLSFLFSIILTLYVRIKLAMSE
jgi:hypothetical protein